MRSLKPLIEKVHDIKAIHVLDLLYNPSGIDIKGN